MKKLFFLLFLLPNILLSQELEELAFEVKVSDRFNVGYVSTPLYLHNEEQILIASKTRDSIHLRIFDRVNLTLLSQNAYAAFPKGIGFKGIFQIEQLHHRFFLFYFFEDPLRDIQDIFIQEIDSETGTFIGESKHIYAIKHSNSFNDVNISVDRQHNRFMIHYYRMIKYENDPTFYYEYSLILYDAVGNIINAYTYVPPYSILKIENMNANLYSNGNIHLVINFKNKGESKTAKFDRVEIPFNTGEAEVFSENLRDASYMDPEIFFEKSNANKLIVGLYSDEDKKSRNGFFIMEYDQKDSLLASQKIDIPIACISKYSPTKEQKKLNKKEGSGKNVGIENLRLRELIATKDSSYLLITEKYEESKSDLAIYRYKELYVAKVNAKFQLEWTTKIPKYQSGDAAYGYKYISNGKDHVFIFNDNLDNLLLVETEYPEVLKEYNEGILTACTISNSDGSLKKELILDFEDYLDYDLDVINPSKSIYSTGEGECVFLNTTKNGEFVVFSMRRIK